MSVVVPVFNPGGAFDDLIRSLDRQTLDPTLFEVILCDDGSDDATRARLREVARERPNVRVLELPHSGWPGMPRNHGIGAARGGYVQFVDQDDWLFDAALERLCDYADLHGSDVVVGKEVGVGRDLPNRIFRRDIPHAKLGKDPLLEMLTPHKLFRTSFLRDKAVRFPEGRVRLEDHLFVMRAYFEAETISILASEPCYAWVKHPGSASSSRIDPESYFPHLEAVLDLVERYTEPGRLRDRLLRHWFRGKVLKRLAGRKMIKYPAAYRDRLLDVVIPLANRRFGPGVDGGLAFPHRIRAALLRADERADLLRFARFEAELECEAVVTSANWSRGGGLHLDVGVRITRKGEDALVFESVDAESVRLTSLPLPSLEALPADVLVPGRELSNDHVDLHLADRGQEAPRRIGGNRSDGIDRVSFAIDPVKVFDRADGSRGGALTLNVRRAGWTFDAPLRADPEILAAAGRSPLLAGSTLRLVASDDGFVELQREGAGGVKDLAGRAARRVRGLARRR